MLSPARVNSIQIVEYFRVDNRQAYHTEYDLEVRGATRFLHHLSFPSEELPKFIKKARYSSLYALHQDLLYSFSDINIPLFPPKKPFGNNKAEFIVNRVGMLNEYFKQCFALPQIPTSEPVLKFVSPSHKVTLAIIGPEHVGKRTLVKILTESKVYAQPKTIQKRRSSVVTHCMADLPLDLLLGKTLYRISKIQVFDLIDGTRFNTNFFSNNFDGLLFCDQESTNSTLELYHSVSTKKASLFVTLNSDFFHPQHVYSAFSGLCQLIPHHSSYQ